MPPMKLTPERLAAFCAALAETGVVARACQAVDITRQTAYEWRREIPEFSEAWDNALEIGITALEDEAHRRAFEGVNKPVVHQGQFTQLHRYVVDDEGNRVLDDKGQPKVEPVVDANGQPVVATVKEYSDTLAIFLLKAHKPEKYRENTRMELTGANGGPVQISETERAAKVASLLAVAQARKAGDVSDLV
jgi:hypothetical protein